MSELEDRIKKLPFSAQAIIEDLQKENTELKKQLKRQEELYLDLRNLDCENLEKIEELKKQIGNIKYLNRDEVFELVFAYQHCEINDSEMVTAICNLAYKPITKDRILKEIEHEQINLTGVILEIINRCFIDYEKLPKAKDIIGILQDKIDDKNGENINKGDKDV